MAAILVSRLGGSGQSEVAARDTFERSWKRRILARLIGMERFGEWMCGGILAVARKP
jgi:hypothetical protein